MVHFIVCASSTRLDRESCIHSGILLFPTRNMNESFSVKCSPNQMTDRDNKTLKKTIQLYFGVENNYDRCYRRKDKNTTFVG